MARLHSSLRYRNSFRCRTAISIVEETLSADERRPQEGARFMDTKVAPVITNTGRRCFPFERFPP
jgi:hypothetical protein